MENIQTLLIIVIIALTLLLTLVGVQVVLVIMDVRRALRKVNHILDDTLQGGSIFKPARLASLVDIFFRKKNS